MSGISPNRNKKNQKKSKLNVPKVIQVKSAKLEPNKASRNGSRTVAKSEDNLKTCLKPKNQASSNCYENESNNGDTSSELDAGIVTKIKKMSIRNDGECFPSTSFTDRKEVSHSDSDLVNVDNGSPVVLEYCPEGIDASENHEQYACAYKYHTKNAKSIKFTNQVTVLYFNGEDIISESMEPLKKEIEQQLRNKEMRKEHLITKGHQIDNVYLF